MSSNGNVISQVYEPALKCAVRYDRCCAYFSSSVLVAAAQGFAPFFERMRTGTLEYKGQPFVRLLVNEELSEKDVDVMIDGSPSKEFIDKLNSRLILPEDAMARSSLECLAMMVSKGWLEIRVGVKNDKLGILHAKFGIVYDEDGQRLGFDGSANETQSALLHNKEIVRVFRGWEAHDMEDLDFFAITFKRLWEGKEPDIRTLSLPDAVKEQLIKFAPPEPEILPPVNEKSAAILQAKIFSELIYIQNAPYLEGGVTVTDATCPVSLWPHQLRVVQETSAAWPEGRLLCDEVGMGKTIEAILSIKRKIAGRGVRRALFLVPAGLCRQWQEELREKGGMVVPRLEAGMKLVWPDEPEVEHDTTLVDALRNPFLVMSRETARMEENKAVLLADDDGWDLVLFDESHAARRKSKEEGAFNQANLLLGLMRDLRYSGKARSLMLLSATPMQISPWEPWDLLSVLGEGPPWTSDFDNVRNYYAVIGALERGSTLEREEAAALASQIMAMGIDSAAPLGGQTMPRHLDEAAQWLVAKSFHSRVDLARWLRNCSPLSERLHRNTRNTLRRYYERGIIKTPPASRSIVDEVYEYSDPEERKLHEDLKAYIDARFKELESEKPGKGFVMTIYKRRLSSSPKAIRNSLTKRLERLQNFIKTGATPQFTYTQEPGEESHSDEPRDEFDLPESVAAATAEVGALQPFLDRLTQLGLQDSKFVFFKDKLSGATSDGRRALVFTEYADTLAYLRDQLHPIYGQNLATYSGKGGQVHDGEQWKTVTKDEITRRLAQGAIKLLICTDAASEGLNLQAASALINYDLPWNPGKVEQRIGRIDRIGQVQSELRIRNIFLQDSVDFRVYTMLRERCRLFEEYVGAMQPVLDRARNILEGQGDVGMELPDAAGNIDNGRDAAVIGAAFEHDDEPPEQEAPALVSKVDMIQWLKSLAALPDCSVETEGEGLIKVSLAGFGPINFGIDSGSLDRNPKAKSLALPPVGRTDWLAELHDFFQSKGLKSPVVIASAELASFQSAEVAFIDAEGGLTAIRDLAHLRTLLASWDGVLPGDEDYAVAVEQLRKICEQRVQGCAVLAASASRQGLGRMRQAALRRVLLQVGVLLSILDGNSDDLNGSWYRQINNNGSAGVGLQLAKAKGLFQAWPDWQDGHPGLLIEIRRALNGLESRRETSLRSGTALKAALEDPRFMICAG